MTEPKNPIQEKDKTFLQNLLSSYLSDSEYRVRKFIEEFTLNDKPADFYADHDELAEDLFTQIIDSGDFREFLEYLADKNTINSHHYYELIEKYFPNSPEGTYRESIPEIRESRIPPNPDQTLEPTMHDSEYIQILNAIQISGSEIEKKINTFYKQHEEGLRDTILTGLQTAFPKYSASGETFNVQSKTDILLKHGSGNLFVAECKIWDGQAGIISAINQLMSNLTWRDSKTALLLFVKQSNFSSILSKIPKIVSEHPNYREHTDTKNENCFNFVFAQKDKIKTFKLSVICFDFYHDKTTKRKTTS